MINDYTCPRCHNVFPSSNKMLHEFRCTAENPVPLNESRMVIQNELENKQNNQNNNENNNNNPEIKNNENIIPPIPQIPQMPPPIEDNFKNLNINELFNLNNEPKEFFCAICKKNIDEKDKVDHLLCHNLANEQENEINNNGNNGNNNINDLYGFSQKEIEEQRKIERQIERNKRKNQQNQNIRRNDFNNRNNNIRNDNINNNHIRPNLNIRRSNTNNSNNNNNTINNNHRNYQNNRSNINSNQQNRGPVITIRQTGQNGNTITTRFYQDIDFSAGPRMNFISNRIRTNNNNNNNNNNHRRGDFNVFNQFRNEFAEILNNGHQHHQHNQHQRTDRQLFNEFPETKIDDVDKLDPEKRNCIICLEDFKSGEKATLLPCVHLFHKNCINRWLTTKDFCPICKFELTRDNINRQNSKF